MKVYVMDLLPYSRHFEDAKKERFLPYPLGRGHFDPEIAADSYEEHFQIWEEMDRLGFDGVGLNEHHTTPHGLQVSPNMIAAAASQRVKKLKFFMLGNLIPLHNPVRIAEEIAMADCLSRGRVIPGFARGVPREYKVYDVPMADSRARFEESLEIILKAWTEESFSHEGRFWKFKDIAIWPRPFQQPHPPVWIPFTGSKETMDFAGRHGFSAVVPGFKPGVVEDIVGYFARALAKGGHRLTPDKLCLFTDAFVADDRAAALRDYAPYYLYFQQTLWHHGNAAPKSALSNSGYVASTSYDYVRPENRAFIEMDRAKIRDTTLQDVEQRVMSGQYAWGNANEVVDKLIATAEHMGANSLLVSLNLGAPPHKMFLEQIRRFGREVLPKLQAHQVKRVPAAQVDA